MATVTININLGRAALLTLGAAVLAAAAYWYASPYLAIRQLQTAAQNGDAQAFNERVDYPRVRDSLKAQMSAMVADKVGKPDSSNPFAALGGMLGLAMVDTAVDAMVRPDIVMMGLRSGKFAPPPKSADAGSGTPQPAQPDPQQGPAWVYERKGLDRLVAYRSRNGVADEAGVGIVFERNGFANWKLTDIRLPPSKP